MTNYLTGGLFANVSHFTNVKEVVTHLIKQRPQQLLCSLTENNIDLLEEYFRASGIKCEPIVISEGGRKKEVEISGLKYDKEWIPFDYDTFMRERKPQVERSYVRKPSVIEGIFDDLI